MRTASVALTNHIAGEVATLARLWKVSRADGLVLRFTDCNTAVKVDVGDGAGVQTFRNDISFTSSAILTSSSAANAQSVTVEAAMDDAGIKEADIRARLFDGAAAEIFAVNYADTSMGVVSLFKGTFGQVRLTDKHRVMIEVKPSATNAKNVGLEKYSQTCNVSLFSARCGLSAAAFKTSITVTAVSENVLVASALTQVDDYFSLGYVVWKTGNNAGQVSPIQGSNKATTSVTLNSTPLLAIQVGDTADVYPGCNKYVETCLNKFNNVVNFQGQWAVPKQNNILTNQIVSTSPGLSSA